MAEVVADFDVVVIGAGPAGCASAISAVNHDYPFKVAIIDAGPGVGERVGETLQPGIREILEHLGVWQAFLADEHMEGYGSTAAWGSAESHENEFLFSRERFGWHLNRHRFDAMMREQARQRGIAIFEGEQLVAAGKDGPCWQLSVTGSQGPSRTVTARFVVDASGRAARLAGLLGVRKVAIDALRAAVVFYDRAPSDEGTYLQIEAAEDGWWYTAGLPDGRRVVALMMDHEVGKTMPISQGPVYERLLRQTTYISRYLPQGGLNLTPIVRSAATQRLDEFCGGRWLAVGDAACAHDPLSSRGIHHALKTGIMAGHAIYDLFIGNPAGILKYQATLAADFESFLSQRREIYREERRWADSAFWRKRHCPVTLDPRATLCLADRAAAEQEMTQRPMWLRPVQWRQLLSLFSEPRPAHEVVQLLRAESAERLTDWRIVEAIQQLLSVRVLSFVGAAR